MVRRYCVIAFMLLCVCLAVQPISSAYATEGSEGGDFSYKVVYGPSTPTILGSTKQVQVYAPNNYEAALIVLGYQNDSRLTSDSRALLSNQSTGGTFYDFAQGFSNNNDYWGNQLNFQDLGMNSALSMNNSMYGANNIWSSEYDQAMYDGAKQRVENVLNGNISGGGSTPMPDDGTYVQLPLTIYDATIYTFQNVDSITYFNGVDGNFCYNLGNTPYYLPVYANGSSSRNAADDFSISISKELYNRLLSEMQSVGWSDACIKVSFDYEGYYNRYDLSFGIYHKDKLSKYIDKNGNFVAWNYPSGTEYYGVKLSSSYMTKPNPYPDTIMELPNALKYNGTYRDKTKYTFTGYTNTPNIMWGTYETSTAIFDKDGVVSDPTTPTIPPTNWPENPTPTPPQPPEVPSPPNDPVSPQPPEPTDPTNPVYPTIVYEPDFVWQTADLSAILSAMDAHCRHLQAALHRECSNLWANLSVKIGTEFKTLRSFLHGQFDWLVDSIDEEFDDFELYLKTLFEWLADQMEFSVTGGGYDDNTVVSWLKKIYSKLGGGTNTRPVDPTVEPDNWWDWLTRLIADWIAGLTDMGLDELAGLLDMLQELITKFPFSIPWDIAALLALLVSEPVTPEIRMPQMALTGSGLTQVGEYVVNLSDYNAVWEGVRFIEKVGFCIFLAWNTVHFMDLFKKGANSE